MTKFRWDRCASKARLEPTHDHPRGFRIDWIKEKEKAEAGKYTHLDEFEIEHIASLARHQTEQDAYWTRRRAKA
jgi:hypothetical protein